MLTITAQMRFTCLYKNISLTYSIHLSVLILYAEVKELDLDHNLSIYMYNEL
jgi:hypothetical protein